MAEFPVIPGYRIEKELGQGGMATVFLGFEEKLQRLVAVKAMSLGTLQDQSLAQRFIKEARTAANLVHSNIVSIFDVGEHQGVFFMAMEFLPNGSLRERILAGSLSVEQALAIVRQVAAALAYAHSEGFVHRDIKPENILFRKDGTPVLADFGIAKATGSTTKLTKTGMSIGTPHYMSPEQARGQAVDARSDLYSLGIVLYEMLTGKVPYEAEDSVAIAIKHIQEPVPRFSGELFRFQPLLDCLLAKAPEQRAQNAEELIKMLRTVADYRISSIPLENASQAIPPSPTPRQVERPTRVASMEEMAPFLSVKLPGKNKNKLVFALVAILAALVVTVIIVLLPSKKEKIAEQMPGKIYENNTSVTSDREKAIEEQQVQDQQNELANLIKGQNEKIKQLELLAATATETQRRSLELAKQRLEESKRQRGEESLRLKNEEEKQKQLEAEQLQKEEEAKKVQEELNRKKREEERTSQQFGPSNVKEGDVVALNKVDVQPVAVSTPQPNIPASIRSELDSKTFLLLNILINQNGDVEVVRLLQKSINTQLNMVLIDTLKTWKYKPAIKNGVEVKVWKTVPILIRQ